MCVSDEVRGEAGLWQMATVLWLLENSVNWINTFIVTFQALMWSASDLQGAWASFHGSLTLQHISKIPSYNFNHWATQVHQEIPACILQTEQIMFSQILQTMPTLSHCNTQIEHSLFIY